MKHCNFCIHQKCCDSWAVTSGLPFANADMCDDYESPYMFISKIAVNKHLYSIENGFIFVIYDINTYDILYVFDNESACIKYFNMINKICISSRSLNWTALNLRLFLKSGTDNVAELEIHESTFIQYQPNDYICKKCGNISHTIGYYCSNCGAKFITKGVN